jgi:predicted nucleic acid-binding protein
LIVLDASLAIEWLLGPPSLGSIAPWDELTGLPVLAPSHWALEISNTLRSDLRTNKLSPSDFFAIMGKLDLLGIQLEPAIGLDEIGPLTQFSVTHNLTASDAAYVQLALQRNATLATLDRAMRTAATKLNIPLIPAAP